MYWVLCFRVSLELHSRYSTEQHVISVLGWGRSSFKFSHIVIGGIQFIASCSSKNVSYSLIIGQKILLVVCPVDHTIWQLKTLQLASPQVSQKEPERQTENSMKKSVFYNIISEVTFLTLAIYFSFLKISSKRVSKSGPNTRGRGLHRAQIAGGMNQQEPCQKLHATPAPGPHTANILTFLLSSEYTKLDFTCLHAFMPSLQPFLLGKFVPCTSYG